jgi:hypothetical protein
MKTSISVVLDLSTTLLRHFIFESVVLEFLEVKSETCLLVNMVVSTISLHDVPLHTLVYKKINLIRVMVRDIHIKYLLH